MTGSGGPWARGRRRGVVGVLAISVICALAACSTDGPPEPAEQREAVVALAAGVQDTLESTTDMLSEVHVIDDGTTARPCAGGEQYRVIFVGRTEPPSGADVDTALDLATTKTTGALSPSLEGAYPFNRSWSSDGDDVRIRRSVREVEGGDLHGLAVNVTLMPIDDSQLHLQFEASTICG